MGGERGVQGDLSDGLKNKEKAGQWL